MLYEVESLIAHINIYIYKLLLLKEIFQRYIKVFEGKYFE